MKRLIILIFIILINILFHTTLGNNPNCFEIKLMNITTDTAKVMAYNKYARDLLKEHSKYFTQALHYAQIGLTLAENVQFEKGKAELLRTIGSVYYYMNDYDNAIDYYNFAMNICEKMNDLEGLALNYYNIGLCYREQSKIYCALNAEQQALSIWKQLGNTDNIIRAHRTIIGLYKSIDEFELAISYTEEAINLAIENGNKHEEASLYDIFAKINFQIGDIEKAKELFRKSLEIYGELNEQLQIARIKHNIAVRLYINEPDTAIYLLQKSVKIYEKLSQDNQQLFHVCNSLANMYQMKNQDDSVKKYKELALFKAIFSENAQTIANAYDTIGVYYMKIGDINNAEKNFRKAYDIALKTGINNVLSYSLSGLSSIRYQKGDYKSAYDYLHEYKIINDSLIRDENVKNIQQLTMKYEFEKKMTESKESINAQLERQQHANKYQRTVVAIISIALIFTAIMLISIIRSNRRNKIANVKLKEQNEEIIEHHDLIANQKKEITDSIVYAQRIQRAILPSQNVLKNYLDMFIFYRPRDIVSGDFYWMAKKENNLFIVAADCTGHGVPGAFMSLLGVSFLKEIVNKENEVYANEILNKLREKVVKSLNQENQLEENEEYTTDGMDIAICVIDYAGMCLQYAGAYNPLILIRNNELKEIKADKMPVGYSEEHQNNKFTNNIISLLPNDCIYMFTDGFADQFGGKEDKIKKYSRKRLKVTLLKINTLPVKEQKKVVEQIYDEWKGDNEQIDDVLLLGIKI